MKEKIKKYILVLSLLILLLVFPLTSNALDIDNDYYDIADTVNVSDSVISISGLTFVDHSNISTRAFGLSGQIKNELLSDVDVTVTTTYYDEYYSEITTTKKEIFVEARNEKLYNDLYNIEKLDGIYSVKDIAYYTIKLNSTIDDNEENNFINRKPSTMDEYEYYPYVLDSYDVRIVVNEDNSYDITEIIGAYFKESRHGIIRSLPLTNNIIRTDGSTGRNRAMITNTFVDSTFTTYKEDNMFKIKIGSPHYEIVGEKNYIINYKYNIGKDKSKKYDELYFNIIGTEWDTAIGNVTFTIVMPKEFDVTKLGFSHGKQGSTVSDDIVYNVNGNVISGYYKGVLDQYNGLTVRCELPEGYFSEAKYIFDEPVFKMIIIPLLGLAFSFVLWVIFGRDDPVIETVEFYPPEGLNSLELAFMYKGYADSKDVNSLLIYLASKGYIKIIEMGSTFKIKKLKEYDGNNEHEKMFMKELFKYNKDKGKFYTADMLASKNNLEELKKELLSEEVSEKDLKYKFYKSKNIIMSNIDTKQNKRKIFKKTGTATFLAVCALICSIIAFLFIPAKTLGYYDELISNISPLIIIFLFVGMSFLELRIKKVAIFGIIGFGFVLISLFAMLFNSSALSLIFMDSSFVVASLIDIVIIIGIIICIINMSKRTKYGNSIYGKIKGFKFFLETVEKEQLEAMVQKDPSYFYDILPYTYVLNISDKWISKFESIGIQSHESEGFQVNNMSSFMGKTMLKIDRAMGSAPPSSSGGSGGSGGSSSGGSSGGGSSGGGSGGGGGSSW